MASNRIVGTNNITTNTFAQMLVSGHRTGYTFRAFQRRIFPRRNTSRRCSLSATAGATRNISDMERSSSAVDKTNQLTTVQTAFHAIVFHHPHDRAPAGFSRSRPARAFRSNHAPACAAYGSRFSISASQKVEGASLKLITTRTVIAQLGVQFIATLAGAFFRPAVGANANIANSRCRRWSAALFRVVRAF